MWKTFVGWWRKFSSRDHHVRFSHFPNGKFVVGRELSSAWWGFLHFLHPPTTHPEPRGLQLRTWCCQLPRRVGIIAFNHSHKLKSFYGISTLLFSIWSYQDFFHLPERKEKKEKSYSRRTSEKNTQRRISKGGVNEKLSSWRWHRDGKKAISLFIFCVAFWGSHLCCFSLLFVLFS